jgi:triacylglycerol lipase
MNSVGPLSLVDPELRPALSSLPDFSALSDASLPAFRSMLGGDGDRLGRDGALTVSRVAVPSGHGADPIPALLYRPQAAAGNRVPALLNLHGGGYVAGCAQREDAAMRVVARELGCIVLTPDYRLAPDSPYPAALDDSESALQWLYAEAATLSIDTERIAVRGSSAGGGLALGLALRLRDNGGARMSFLQLIYPMLDDRTKEHAYTGKFVWTAAANRFGWDSLLRGQDRADPPPCAVPGRERNVAGLPPVFLAVGSIDLFARENLELAMRLIDAGIAVEMHLYPGAYHGFPLVADSRVAKSLSRDAIASLRTALNLNGGDSKI